MRERPSRTLSRSFDGTGGIGGYRTRHIPTPPPPVQRTLVAGPLISFPLGPFGLSTKMVAEVTICHRNCL
jgi:hypothetical protein